MRIASLIATVALVFALSSTAGAQSHFKRGDANDDNQLNLGDAVFVLGYLFSGGQTPPCLDAADANDDGAVGIADGIYLLGYLFTDGPQPPEPFVTWEGDPTADPIGCKDTLVVHTGDIVADETWAAGVTHVLESGVFVKSGVTLTIEAGVTVIGDNDTQGLLVVERGGQLVANGTATLPIVMTSEMPVGSRSRGDWGGLIVLGNGISNLPGGEGEAEGLTGQTWGGGASPIPDESSGSLSYLRVEFGGTEISPDNEVNSISLFGIGSGTTLHHIQCKYNLDDGFEWFGGSCFLSHAICVGIGDDNFDYSFGWNGGGQFWVAQQRGDDADRGYECDNSESEYGAVPLTMPTTSNVTLIGSNGVGPESDAGIVWRRGVGGAAYNGIVCGFQDAGFDIDDPETTTTGLALDYFTFADNAEDAETGDDELPGDGYAYTSLEFLTSFANNVLGAANPLIDPYNLDAPNFKPAAAIPGVDATTLGRLFAPADYRGAVDPAAATDWTQAGWISYWQN